MQKVIDHLKKELTHQERLKEYFANSRYKSLFLSSPHDSVYEQELRHAITLLESDPSTSTKGKE
jgi:hypothetical protein